MTIFSPARAASLVFSLGLVALPAMARAQSTCLAGLIVVDSFGHCCAPGQAWNAAANQCAGPAFPAPPTVTGTANLLLSAPPGIGFASSAALGSLNPNAPVTVTFVPEQAGDIEVLQIVPIVGQAVACNIPCVARLTPGYVTITGSGQRQFESGINIPPLGPLTVRVNHHNSHAGAYATGAVMTIVGLGATILGGVAMANDGSSSSSSSASSSSNSLAIGIVGVTLGSILLCIGPTVLLVAGAADEGPLSVVEPGEVTTDTASRSSRVRFAGISPAAFVGGGGLVTGFTF